MSVKTPIIITGDGSSTLFDPVSGDHYHSLHGAEAESRHVFINAGLVSASLKFSDLNILEVGMGTGLNTLLTFQHALVSGRKISYTGLEPFPLAQGLVDELQFSVLAQPENNEFFKSIHRCSWEQWHVFARDIRFRKFRTTLQDTQPGKGFNLVYYDAFGPKYQPEMWETKTLLLVYEHMMNDGILVTYCAQGAFRRSLKNCGFKVESLPGPKGKREMTRAVKT